MENFDGNNAMKFGKRAQICQSLVHKSPTLMRISHMGCLGRGQTQYAEHKITVGH